MPSLSIAPDFGPRQPHRTAGATVVGARPALVAYNVWVPRSAVARRVAPLVRGPAVRALALAVGERAQVSCNLVDPATSGPAELYDLVADQRRGGRGDGHRSRTGRPPTRVDPQAVISARWAQLDLSPTRRSRARLRGQSAPQRTPYEALAGCPRVAALKGPGPPYPPTLPLAHAAPDAEFLSVGQGVLEAVLAHDTAPAHFLRLTSRCTPFRKEQVRVHSHAVRLNLPAAFLATIKRGDNVHGLASLAT